MTSLPAREPEQTEWRAEVAQRLGEFRSRRYPEPAEEAQPEKQSGLPFHRSDKPQETVRERPRRSIQSQRKPERLEICIQPELHFSSAADDRAHPQTALVPVATLAARRRAGALDAFFIGLTSACFVALFRYLGGHITLGKIDILVFCVVLYLFYVLYFLLFTGIGGTTPGMQLAGLSCVRLDGTLPDTSQLLWRGFGYLLSGGAILLGFAWSLWDEDHFTWQDRISHTYLTSAQPVGANEY